MRNGLRCMALSNGPYPSAGRSLMESDDMNSTPHPSIVTIFGDQRDSHADHGLEQPGASESGPRRGKDPATERGILEVGRAEPVDMPRLRTRARRPRLRAQR